MEELAAGVRAGKRAMLGRALSIVESTRAEHQQQAQSLLERLLPHTGGARRLGISGVPGAGKSTFIDALGMRLIRQGCRVAVLAVDPSSSLSGGSILGDKTRMSRLAAEPDAFIRPSPSGGTLGGVASRTRESILLCEAAGFEVVVVETVGVGQSEAAVRDLVDCFIALMLPGAGDELQGIKRGLLELVDLIAVNKADGELQKAAESAASHYRSALHYMAQREAGCEPQVLTCSALTGAGIEEIWQAAEQRLQAERSSGRRERRRQQQSVRWLERLVEEGLRARFEAHPSVQRARAEVTRAVEHGAITPSAGAARLLELSLGDPASPPPGGADSTLE